MVVNVVVVVVVVMVFVLVIGYLEIGKQYT